MLSPQSVAAVAVFLAAMAPKCKPESLALFHPTTEEVKAARDILAAGDAKKKRSSMACMVAYVNKHGEADGHAAILSSRGAEREAYLQNYLAFMQRKKCGTLTSSSVHLNATQKMTDYHNWNRHKLTTEVGEATAKAWIESGKLKYDPDRITASVDE